MGSDCSSSPSPAGKICQCSCGKRMSNLKFDFYTVCIQCQGVDCALDARCIECGNIIDVNV